MHNPAIVEASGEKFLIYADSENRQEISTSTLKKYEQLHGIIRAVATKNLGETGAQFLLEEPEAKWYLDQQDRHGKTIELSGNGLRAFVKYLLDTGLHKMTDRRQTLSVATPSGIRDTLVGVVGVSADLGRWQLKRSDTSGSQQVSGNYKTENDETKTAETGKLLIKLGRLHQVQTEKPEITTLTEAGTTNYLLNPSDPTNQNATVTPNDTVTPKDTVTLTKLKADRLVIVTKDSVKVVDGVGQARATFYDFENLNTQIPSSGTGAVAAALYARHFSEDLLDSKIVPNHWKIETSAGPLAVRMFATEDGEHVSINGPAIVLEEA